MAKDLDSIIAQRTETAQARMEGQGPVRRVVSALGLHAANGLDRATGWGHNNKTVFLSGALVGAMRGMFYGALGAFALAAFFPGMISAGLIIGASALAFAVHDSQKSLDYKLGSNPRRLPDVIAQASGAAPGAHRSPQKQGPELNEAVEKALADGRANNPEFAARERARRARFLSENARENAQSQTQR